MNKRIGRMKYHLKSLWNEFIELLTDIKIYIIINGWHSTLLVVSGLVCTHLLSETEEQRNAFREYLFQRSQKFFEAFFVPG